ncbi:MAG TPA: formylglycine-generating enzyme family protein, partial [Spirochaetia bacterium]|nr:formylglycine-generating enzyme family protein [Spirochaetia bacterium]
MRTPFFFGLLVLAWWAGAQDLPSPLVKAVLVDGGTFPQGKRTLDPAAEGRTVTVSSFWMAEAEVTQSQYRAVTGQSPSRFSGEVNPVERVSWYDAVAFCNALSEKEGLKAVYTIDGTKVTADWTATGWRLPTEAEWEFAARGGTHSQGFAFSGSDEADKVGYGFYNSGKRTSP